MDNVLNRPLFRHREARDRLNESVGVQRFNVGGVVAGAGNPDFGGGSRAPQGVYADPSGAVMPQYRRAPIRPAGLASLSTAQEDTMAEDRGLLFSNALLVAAREKVEMAQRRFENDPSGINQQRYADAVAELEAAQGENATVMEEYNPGPISNIQDRGVLDVEGPEAMVSQMSPEQLDIFNNLGRAADNVVPDTAAPKPVPVGPSGMEIEARRGRPMGPSGMEAEARRARPPAPGEEPAPLGRSTMEADARDRGPLIMNPADVAAGLNAEDPAVREKTVTDFMKEYSDAAPKYEGVDKNLLLAQIGFAIAAGESPNAMQNIANGLLAGSDVLMKDKASKAEFDRQVQLSAMQYGFETAGAERERGRQPLSFVALEDTVYKGKPVKKGQPVMIPYSEIERNGGMVPAGFGDSTMVTALAEKRAAVFDALEEARKENLVDDTFVETQRKGFAEASDRALSAQRGIEYMEAALITIGEGGVVGLKGSANQVIKDGLALFGLSQADQFDSREEALSLVSKGFQNLIPVAFSGTQTGNSISNFDVEQLAKAYVDAMFKDGVFSLANVTEEKLMNSLKGALELLESGRQSALTNMNSIEKTLTGRTLRSGDAATSILDPYREMVPQEEDIEVPSALGNLYRSDDGIYRLRVPGG
jgi:hypothetical protein